MTLLHTATQNRARSRLHKKRAVGPPVVKASVRPWSHHLRRSSNDGLPPLELTSQKLVLVLLFGLSGSALALLLTTVSPSKVADILLPQTYLPLLLLVGLMAFAASRFFLRLRHAVSVTALVIGITFVRVHSVRLPLSYIIVPLLLLTAIEITILLVKKR